MSLPPYQIYSLKIIAVFPTVPNSVSSLVPSCTINGQSVQAEQEKLPVAVEGDEGGGVLLMKNANSAKERTRHIDLATEIVVIETLPCSVPRRFIGNASIA